MNAVALFCGAGGATHGMVRAGLDVVMAVDAWPVACEAHRRWAPTIPVQEGRCEDVAARAEFVNAHPHCLHLWHNLAGPTLPDGAQ